MPDVLNVGIEHLIERTWRVRLFLDELANQRVCRACATAMEERNTSGLIHSVTAGRYHIGIGKAHAVILVLQSGHTGPGPRIDSVGEDPHRRSGCVAGVDLSEGILGFWRATEREKNWFSLVSALHSVVHDGRRV